MKEKLVVGLIKGRHEMPVSDYIFESEIEDVFDFNALNERIIVFLEDKVGISLKYSCGLNQWGYEDVQCLEGAKRLVVYVTGLTSVTAALIALCAERGVKLTLMHFDRETNDYKEQIIF